MYDILCNSIDKSSFFIFILFYLGIANGCAEDALSLAETVASFGAIDLEEERYANALARVSKSSMKVRYSFSLLKLMQSIILGVGAGTLILVTWKTSTADFLTGKLKNILQNIRNEHSLYCEEHSSGMVWLGWGWVRRRFLDFCYYFYTDSILHPSSFLLLPHLSLYSPLHLYFLYYTTLPFLSISIHPLTLIVSLIILIIKFYRVDPWPRISGRPARSRPIPLCSTLFTTRSRGSTL
jgi:hypothetical protein